MTLTPTESDRHSFSWLWYSEKISIGSVYESCRGKKKMKICFQVCAICKIAGYVTKRCKGCSKLICGNEAICEAQSLYREHIEQCGELHARFLKTIDHVVFF